MLVQSFSGIRGIYGEDLTEGVVRRYVHVFRDFLKKKLEKEPLIVVSTDTRHSRENIRKAALMSLPSVIDVGIMPIAVVELAVREYKADGGIYVTASHNPPEYNGLKFLDSDGAVLRPNDIKTIIDEFKKLDNVEDEEKEDIEDKSKDIIVKYSTFLKKIIGEVKNNINIIVDVNGGSGITLKDIIDQLKIDNIKIINDEIGEFKREIEPNENSLRYLKEIIEKENAEFAAGFDCDADRVEILLKDGSIVDGNSILALIADDILSKKKGTVVTNDATSNVVKNIVEKYDCEVKEVEVGEINVVDEMIKSESPIGGEGSNGGVIIPPSRCRDGILSLLYLLKIINESDKPLNQLISELPKYYSIQKKVKINGSMDIKSLKDKIKEHYSTYEIKETGDDSGGLKIIINNDSFVWFRASKTEPNLLRVIADSKSKTESKKLLDDVFSIL